MKRIITCVLFVQCLPARVDFTAAIESLVQRLHASENYDPRLWFKYHQLKQLEALCDVATTVQSELKNSHDALIGQLAQLNNKIQKIQDGNVTYTMQAQKVSDPWYKLFVDTSKNVIDAVQQHPYTHCLKASRPLQAAVVSAILVAAINIRLYRLQRAYHAALNEQEKAHYKELYQSFAGKLLAILGLEKAITIPLRDASIGFWGNGPVAQRFFGLICDWISLRTLFFIDEALLSR